MKKVKIVGISPHAMFVIFSDIFLVSLVSYLGILMVEEFSAQYFTLFFDLRGLLVIMAVSGICLLFFGEKDRLEEDSAHVSKQTQLGEWLMMGALSLLGGLLVFFGNREVRWMSAVLGVLTTGLILLISYFVVKDDSQSPSD